MWKDILLFLQTESVTPKPYDIYHLSWLIVTVLILVILYFVSKNHNERKLKWILSTYAISTLILETLKQLIWSIEYDSITNSFIWDYEWYAFPFQLCTMPIYICLICCFLRKNKIRDALLSFIAYTTILGSIASAIIPDALFVSDVLVNIHAMWLHIGSLIVSVYLFMSKEVKVNKNSFFSAIIVFLICAGVANLLNIVIYNSGVLNGETFNMYYISPYFESTLPVFNNIYNLVPYPVFLVIYIVAITLGSAIVFVLAKGITKIKEKINIVKG